MNAVGPVAETGDDEKSAAIDSRRETAGILLALLAHLLTLGPYGVLAFVGSPRQLYLSWWFFLIGQVVVLVACVGSGIRLWRRGDRSLGRGLLVGWPFGLLALPLVIAVIVGLSFVAHG